MHAMVFKPEGPLPIIVVYFVLKLTIYYFAYIYLVPLQLSFSYSVIKDFKLGLKIIPPPSYYLLFRLTSVVMAHCTLPEIMMRNRKAAVRLQLSNISTEQLLLFT